MSNPPTRHTGRKQMPGMSNLYSHPGRTGRSPLPGQRVCGIGSNVIQGINAEQNARDDLCAGQ
jgi:hypothetical protein